MRNDETVNVRYMVDDVDAAVAFYTTKLGFELLTMLSLTTGSAYKVRAVTRSAILATFRSPSPGRSKNRS